MSISSYKKHLVNELNRNNQHQNSIISSFSHDYFCKEDKYLFYFFLFRFSHWTNTARYHPSLLMNLIFSLNFSKWNWHFIPFTFPLFLQFIIHSIFFPIRPKQLWLLCQTRPLNGVFLYIHFVVDSELWCLQIIEYMNKIWLLCNVWAFQRKNKWHTQK